MRLDPLTLVLLIWWSTNWAKQNIVKDTWLYKGELCVWDLLHQNVNSGGHDSGEQADEEHDDPAVDELQRELLL